MAADGDVRRNEETRPDSQNGAPPGQTGVVLCLTILTTLAVLYTAFLAKSLFIPFFLAVFFSAVLWPAVAAMNRIRIPVAVAAAIATFLPPVVIGLLVHTATPSAEVWRYRVPAFVYEMELKLDTLFDSVRRARDFARQANELAAGKTPAPAAEAPTGGRVEKEQPPAPPVITPDILWSVPVTAAMVVATLILTYFMLVAGPALARWAVGDPLEDRRLMRLAVVARQSLRDISTYYRTVAVINFGLGLVVWGVMAALGMPEPYLWGAMICVFNFIPFIGPIAAGLIITIVSIIQFDGTLRILAPPLAFTLITCLEGYFITPWLVGKALTLNPLLVLLSILFWGWMWGLAGALLAIPLVAVAIRIIRFAASENATDRAVPSETG